MRLESLQVGQKCFCFFSFYDFILKLLRKENSNYYYEILTGHI